MHRAEAVRAPESSYAQAEPPGAGGPEPTARASWHLGGAARRGATGRPPPKTEARGCTSAASDSRSVVSSSETRSRTPTCVRAKRTKAASRKTGAGEWRWGERQLDKPHIAAEVLGCIGAARNIRQRRGRLAEALQHKHGIRML